MLRWFRNRNNSGAIALELYGSSVAQARLPDFYRAYGIADTFSGRFEVVMLHVGLLLRRVSGAEGADQALGQGVVEEMFRQLDDDLRELGVGDLTVPKKVQAAAGSFYGRLKAVEAALARPDNAELTQVLNRNLTAAEGGQLQPDAIAGYVREVVDKLAGQSLAQLQQGRVTYPQPKEAYR